VRLGVSRQAATTLLESRVRRLLAFELDGEATLAPGNAGPLGDNVAWVWVDMPSPSSAVVEVRVAEHTVARREIAVEGLVPDVAARLIAIAAAETIRDQTRPARPRKPLAPKAPSPDEQPAALGGPAVAFGAALDGAWLPGSSGGVVGPALSLSLRQGPAGLRIFGSYLGGSIGEGRLRWLEAGLAGEYRAALGPRTRLVLGAAASAAAVHLADASSVDGVAGTSDTWSARGSGVLGLELRYAGPNWIGLALEPGAILRPAPFTTVSGARGMVEGAFLGLTLSASIELPTRPRPVPPPAAPPSP
jgi:hypothetical protein